MVDSRTGTAVYISSSCFLNLRPQATLLGGGSVLHCPLFSLLPLVYMAPAARKLRPTGMGLGLQEFATDCVNVRVRRFTEMSFERLAPALT